MGIINLSPAMKRNRNIAKINWLFLFNLILFLSCAAHRGAIKGAREMRYEFWIAGDERLERLDLMLALQASQQGEEMPDHIIDGASCLAASHADLQEQIEAGINAGQAPEARQFNIFVDFDGARDDAQEALTLAIFEGEPLPKAIKLDEYFSC
jgi:hypothetical protein